MDLGIKGKNVLVTGASQGMGKDIAIAFAREGCNVSIISRKEEKLKQVIKEMHIARKEELMKQTIKKVEEQNHDYYAIDLMPEGNPTKAVKDLIKKNGVYDIVIHDVGGTLEMRDPVASFENWYKVWRFNVGISIEMNHLLIPLMQKQKWGRVINISSESATGLRGCPAYGVSKAYLNAYTKVLGKRIATDGVVVSAICPGAVYGEGGHWDENSPRNPDKKAFRKKVADFLRHHQAIGRFGRVEEISSFALFMASKHVTFANGSVIYVDGGTE